MSSYRQILYHIVFRTEKIINYIKNQQEHHKKETFLEEYRRLIEENGIVIDDTYFP